MQQTAKWLLFGFLALTVMFTCPGLAMAIAGGEIAPGGNADEDGFYKLVTPDGTVVQDYIPAFISLGKPWGGANPALWMFVPIGGVGGSFAFIEGVVTSAGFVEGTIFCPADGCLVPLLGSGASQISLQFVEQGADGVPEWDLYSGGGTLLFRFVKCDDAGSSIERVPYTMWLKASNPWWQGGQWFTIEAAATFQRLEDGSEDYKMFTWNATWSIDANGKITTPPIFYHDVIHAGGQSTGTWPGCFWLNGESYCATFQVAAEPFSGAQIRITNLSQPIIFPTAQGDVTVNELVLTPGFSDAVRQSWRLLFAEPTVTGF